MGDVMKYIYGPVSSWRLGKSLGIDLLSQDRKMCNFNCNYCQVGDEPFHTVERAVYVRTEDVLKELKTLDGVKCEFITFSGRGEPTIAANLGEVIDEIKKMRREKIAVFTNSALMHVPEVRDELSRADLVCAKIDAATEKTFGLVNRPDGSVRLMNVLEGIKAFRDTYKSRFAVQMMFTRENIGEASAMADIARSLRPDEVQLNTPLRHRVTSTLSASDMEKVKAFFKGLNIVSVYDRPRTEDDPLDKDETQRRRG